MIYFLIKDGEELLTDDNGDVLRFNSQKEAIDSLKKEGWDLEAFKEEYSMLSTIKLLDEENIEIPEPTREVSEKVEFNMTARAAIHYLNEYHHPHTTMIITPTSAEVVEGVKAFKTEEFLKD